MSSSYASVYIVYTFFFARCPCMTPKFVWQFYFICRSNCGSWRERDSSTRKECCTRTSFCSRTTSWWPIMPSLRAPSFTPTANLGISWCPKKDIPLSNNFGRRRRPSKNMLESAVSSAMHHRRKFMRNTWCDFQLLVCYGQLNLWSI